MGSPVAMPTSLSHFTLCHDALPSCPALPPSKGLSAEDRFPTLSLLFAQSCPFPFLPSEEVGK